MPEINNTNNFINNNNNNVHGIQKQDKVIDDKIVLGDEPSKECTTNLKNDPKGVTGRSLVHSTKSKEAQELKKRVDGYVEEFLKDQDKATYMMDSVDTFKDAGLSLEEATEATIKLAGKIGTEKLDAIKDMPEIGSYIAGVCVSLMNKPGMSLDKSIDAVVKTIDLLSSNS